MESVTQSNLKLILEKLESEDIEEKILAIKDLGDMDNDEAIMALNNVLGDDDPQVRFQAAEALARIGEPAVPFLLETMKHDESARRYAILALKKIGDPRVIRDLIAALDDGDWGVRKVAARTLGELKAVDALEPLIKTLEDDDWGVRLAAVRSLGDLQDQRAIEPIKKARRKARGDKDFKKAANKALKKIG